MRRFFFILTVLSISAWSQQPAQQQSQPPIVVQVQMPPTNPWIHSADLIVPGIIGAGIALFGVWLTTKHSDKINAANQQHELDKLNRQQNFPLKRDALLRLTQSLVQALAALRNFYNSKEWLAFLEANGEEEKGQAEEAKLEIPKAGLEYHECRRALDEATACASLAVSGELWRAALKIGESMTEFRRLTGVGRATDAALEDIDRAIAAFTVTAKTELGNLS